MKKIRLDEILIQRGILKNKHESFVIVTEGRVFVDGQKAISPAQFINPKAKIEIRTDQEYVGRGAYKLEPAIKKFGIDPKNKICADIGSATGGFTEVLLKNGAKKVYAIDTARGKLALKLREEARVVVMEATDIRNLEKLPEKAEIATIDVSLIKLEEILPCLKPLLVPDANIIALFKPQYQTRNLKILKHGVIKDCRAREKLLHTFIKWAEDSGWKVVDWMESPIKGNKGNIEYLISLQQ